MKQKNKQLILSRYGIIIGISLLISFTIAGKLLYNTYINANKWNAVAEREMNDTSVVTPLRGNILSDNGNILACNLKVYDIKLDLAHDAIKPKIKNKSIDSLADSLDRYFPMKENLDKMNEKERSKHSWHTRLRNQLSREKKNRNRAIYIKKKGTLSDYEKILSFPWVKQFAQKKGTTQCPLYYTQIDMRVYPFGDMAHLSIGRVNLDSATKTQHGYSGLERDLDSLLYGVPGSERKVALPTGMTKWTVRKAKRGYDVYTTINIDMQDMLEEELKRICIQSNAIWGTAIMMEVKSGDIKAISNLEWIEKEGKYGEALNRAVLAYEPGSVMKPISMMIAFEDKLVNSVNDMVDCSPFMGTTDNHRPPVKNMKQVIETSSNTGIARVIFRGYQQNPARFHDRLESIGFFTPFKTGISEERIPFVPRLDSIDRQGHKVTMKARHLALARQAYGYNTMIPPLYTMAYYNAIANDGVLVYPRLIRSLRDEDGRDSVLKPVTKRICSPATAAKVRECIREVVVSKHGTGHLLNDDRVAIAGKTGTALPISYGAYDNRFRRLAFAGFFPYESPKYTVMVLMLTPAGNSAPRTSGMVLKNMALRLYSRGLLDNSSTFTEKQALSTPTIAASRRALVSKLSADFNLRNPRRFSTKSAGKGKVPDVTGYAPAEAVALLEKLGINVRLKGSGYVAAQSIAPGSPVSKGGTIVLSLKI